MKFYIKLTRKCRQNNQEFLLRSFVLKLTEKKKISREILFVPHHYHLAELVNQFPYLTLIIKNKRFV